MNDSINFSKEFITPAFAKVLLEGNINNNRRLRPHDIQRYATEMKEGRWKSDTAEPIKISKAGILLDGQHRLMAVIKANVSIWMWIARGVPEDVFTVLDTGRNRNASDVFFIAGKKNDSSLPSIIQTYYLLKKGNTAIEHKNKAMTNFQLYNLYLENEDFWQDVCLKANRWYSAFSQILKKSTIGGFYALFQDINHGDANDFFDQLCKGHEIKHTTVNQLREKLIRDKIAFRKMTQASKYALIIKAWNYFRTNSNIKMLKYIPENEKMPVAV